MSLCNRQWLLARHPRGLLQADDLQYREVEINDGETLPPGHIRVRNRVFLCAPTMRNWMEPAGTGLYPTIALGAPVMAPTGAEVIGSTDPRYPVGAKVSLIGSWQDYQTVDTGVRPPQRLSDDLPIADAIGKFGLNSTTAYFGLTRVGQPRAGETLVVSGAAGSTGSVAAQIGKILGCRVIGIAGGAEKCRWLTDEIGLDGAIDYRAGDLGGKLIELAPDGIDIFFDNVGGEILEAAINHMARLGRIIICGQIAGYNRSEDRFPQIDTMRLVYGSVRMQGFLMRDYIADVPHALAELRAWERNGQLELALDVRSGFEQLPQVFNDLFEGRNRGTLLVANT